MNIPIHLALRLLLRVQTYLHQNPKISQHYMYPKVMATEKRESHVDRQLFQLATKICSKFNGEISICIWHCTLCYEFSEYKYVKTQENGIDRCLRGQKNTH